MDRRKALRTIGFGTTAITVTPAVVGMLQSRQSQTTTYTATLFTKDQFAVLSQVMELIIPKTDIPGAVELKLPEFLDGFMSVVFNKQGQQKVVDGLDHFIAVALEDSGKSNCRAFECCRLRCPIGQILKSRSATTKGLETRNQGLPKSG